MTALLCEWCGDRFDRPHRKGRAPRYCQALHRGRAYRARRKPRAENRCRYCFEPIEPFTTKKATVRRSPAEIVGSVDLVDRELALNQASAVGSRPIRVTVWRPKLFCSELHDRAFSRHRDEIAASLSEFRNPESGTVHPDQMALL